MQIFDYYRGEKQSVVVVLGFFDCMHVGHAELLNRGLRLARAHSAACILFTFSTAKNDIEKEKTVYTLEERLCRMRELGADGVIIAPFDEKLRETSAIDFLDGLFSRFQVVGVVCGDDYHYGKGASGNVQTLSAYCLQKGVPLSVVEEIADGGIRVSTSRIAKCLKNGDMGEANRLLGEKFRLTGIVASGRKVGRTLGFPTANVTVDKTKMLPKEGVYYATATANGTQYPALAHVGSRPTYELKQQVVEVWLDGFDGDLYRQEITVHLEEYAREIVAFSSETQLSMQINRDKMQLRKRGKADD